MYAFSSYTCASHPVACTARACYTTGRAPRLGLLRGSHVRCTQRSKPALLQMTRWHIRTSKYLYGTALSGDCHPSRFTLLFCCITYKMVAVTLLWTMRGGSAQLHPPLLDQAPNGAQCGAARAPPAHRPSVRHSGLAPAAHPLRPLPLKLRHDLVAVLSIHVRSGPLEAFGWGLHTPHHSWATCISVEQICRGPLYSGASVCQGS
jgi:hypothetical protein